MRSRQKLENRIVKQELCFLALGSSIVSSGEQKCSFSENDAEEKHLHTHWIELLLYKSTSNKSWGLSHHRSRASLPRWRLPLCYFLGLLDADVLFAWDQPLCPSTCLFAVLCVSSSVGTIQVRSDESVSFLCQRTGSFGLGKRVFIHLGVVNTSENMIKSRLDIMYVYL